MGGNEGGRLSHTPNACGWCDGLVKGGGGALLCAPNVRGHGDVSATRLLLCDRHSKKSGTIIETGAHLIFDYVQQ